MALTPLFKKPPAAKWESTGVREKPAACSMCRYLQKGSGFCPDDSPEGAKIAVLFPFPRPDDVVANRPLSGGAGSYFLEHFVFAMGHKRDEVMALHCLRCTPPKFKGFYAFPTGTTRQQAENTCRLHDKFHGDKGRLVPGGIVAFNPDMFLITHDPVDIFKVPCYHRQMECDMRKAWEFAAAGRRPVVLAGIEAVELVAPWLSGRGGTPKWRSHWEELDKWPFLGENVVRRTFTAGCST